MKLRRSMLAGSFLLLGCDGVAHDRGCGLPPCEDAVELASACSDEGATDCSYEGTLARCSEGAWTEIEPAEVCEVQRCVVCGFAGIDRAGRSRAPARWLRA